MPEQTIHDKVITVVSMLKTAIDERAPASHTHSSLESPNGAHELELSNSGTATITGAGAVTATVQTDANLVTALTSAATDSQYPSAKCVWDIVGDIESALSAINNGTSGT